ncbi:hypothetical protein HHS_05690 [Candidatus Pantoea carbekii]|uniref:Uncharacterized protein n=1 Tax=Candidatus Pantoea carbekii TaxID=1235990 RepID=U3U860_9GAMM|nr:hypothetical protein HHS_05690 [Candidatus Pantoea carbekii]
MKELNRIPLEYYDYNHIVKNKKIGLLNLIFSSLDTEYRELSCFNYISRNRFLVCEQLIYILYVN